MTSESYSICEGHEIWISLMPLCVRQVQVCAGDLRCLDKSGIAAIGTVQLRILTLDGIYGIWVEASVAFPICYFKLGILGMRLCKWHRFSHMDHIWHRLNMDTLYFITLSSRMPDVRIALIPWPCWEYAGGTGRSGGLELQIHWETRGRVECGSVHGWAFWSLATGQRYQNI